MPIRHALPATLALALVPVSAATPRAREAAPRPLVVRPIVVAAAPATVDALVIPVVGVAARSLHDSFTDARSGGREHLATDIMAPRGTPVVSAAEGSLLRLHQSRAGGLMVYAADATDRFILMYAHLDRYAPGLVQGMRLHRGQLLGYVGTTGNAPKNAPHLHFAIAEGKPSVSWWKGRALDPYPMLLRATPALAVAGVQVARPDSVTRVKALKAVKASTPSVKATAVRSHVKSPMKTAAKTHAKIHAKIHAKSHGKSHAKSHVKTRSRTRASTRRRAHPARHTTHRRSSATHR